MNRGLGWLQRELLASLEASTTAARTFRGGVTTRRSPPGASSPRARRVAHSYRQVIELPDGVYDLLALGAFVAHAQPRERLDADGNLTGRFRAGFSKAVRGLVNRGWLVSVEPVPDEPTGWTFADLPAGGADGQVSQRRVRFVRRGPRWEAGEFAG